MPEHSIDTILENQTLKNEFTIRNLNLLQIWIPSPDDLELENRQLRSLLKWVDKYRECPHREQLETQGYFFPPISYDLDPDTDWFRFERWIKGLPVRMRLWDQLPPDVKIRESAEIKETEIEAALDELLEFLESINFAFHLNEQMPARLIYEDLYKMLDEVHEVMGEPGWVMGFCGGYCPGCTQRPWCDAGCNCCWDEDREAGHIVFPDSLCGYVSPSPVSLEIIAARQEEEDRQFNESRKERDDDLPF